MILIDCTISAFCKRQNEKTNFINHKEEIHLCL